LNMQVQSITEFQTSQSRRAIGKGEACRAKIASEKFRRRNEKTVFGIPGGSSFIHWCC
jgi:hypothetical protein